MSVSSRRPQWKFDLTADRTHLDAASKAEPGYTNYLEAHARDLKVDGFKSNGGPDAFSYSAGPFEMTPDLAHVRIVHTMGLLMEGGNACQASINWANIINSLPSKELKAQLSKLSAMQTLPASLKISAATVGDNVAYRNMCHIKVADGSLPYSKTMNTPHLYKRGDGTCKSVGYPMHLLTDDGGYLLEEPPQLTNQFAQYWYISNSMLTSTAYKQESSNGTFVSIPKNSDAARLMYFVLVIKNGAGAELEADNVTKLNAAGFSEEFKDANDPMSWRFPQNIFDDVAGLLAGKLQDVRDKSYNCETMYVDVEAFDIFKETIFKNKPPMPVLITMEIDLHLPEMREAVAADSRGLIKGAGGGSSKKVVGTHIADFADE